MSALLLALLPVLSAPTRTVQQPAAAPPDTHLGAWSHTIEDLEGPVAVGFGPEGELWVAEEHADRVRRFDVSGAQARILEDGAVWGGPSGVAASTRLYVSDRARRGVARGGGARHV